MQYTYLLDKLGLKKLKNPEFVAKIHTSIAQCQKTFNNTEISTDKQIETFDFDTINDAEFETLYSSLVNSVFSLDEPSQNATLTHKSLHLLKWSQNNCHWNAIFSAKISDLDPAEFNNIISGSKFDILNSLYLPYCIALNLLFQEPLVAECIAEPILESFRYNFENSRSKLSHFNKIENSFLFIKLQFYICMVALGKSWISLEENKQLLISNLKVPNSNMLIDKLLEWNPVESVGLVLAKYFKRFILTRLSYFAYDYFDTSTDFIVSVSQLANMSGFDNLIFNGVTKNPENLKVCRILIGGLFNLAIKWNEIDHISSLELLRNEIVPSLTENSESTIDMISHWQNLQADIIEEIIPKIFDTGLIEAFKELLATSCKYCELLGRPESYMEATIGVFINKTLDLIKAGWNEIFNILDSIEQSSKYLKIISDIASLCEVSNIKSLVQLENVYSMREKMHKIFILCIDEHLQAELKYLPRRIVNFDMLEERINVLARHISYQSFSEIFTQVAVNTQKTVLGYVIPSDNLMVVKNESHLELLSENLKQLQLVIPVPMPCIVELVYIFKHSDEDINVNSFSALSAVQANQAIHQALHAKLDFQDFALLPKISN